MRGVMDAISDPDVETVVVMSSAQVGKALALDTPLPSPNGWTTMGDVQVGDRLFDEDGFICTVTGKSPVMQDHRVYRVTFGDGSEIVADAEHRWYVEPSSGDRSRKPGVMNTEAVLADFAGGWTIPVSEAVYDLPGLDLTCPRTDRHIITAIEPVASVPVQCIAVNSPSHLFLAGRSMIPTHNTESLNNGVGYHILHDPAPILVIQPTLEMAEAYSKDRLAPMLRDTPALRSKVAAFKRDSDNTLLQKRFAGGYVTMAGANSPSSLASRPVRIVLCDEVDRYPVSAGEEGDPVSLARKRTTTFWNRKIILTSTPTIKGVSRIEQEWETSDKRYYFVKCDCGHEQRLVWSQVKWPENQPRKAYYVCEDAECGLVWDDNKRWNLIQTRGRWLATEHFDRTAGFHLSEIYSPWVKLGDMAANFVVAKGNPQTLKTWINTSLGESFEDQGETVDATGLIGRVDDWGPYAPDRVLTVTCGVDVQDDRFEVSRIGWGVEEESFALEHRVFIVDPSSPEAWRELDDYLRTPTITHDGRELPVASACIDSGGHYTQAVYNFVRDKVRRKVWAIKGAAGEGRPVWPKAASRNNKGRINLFVVGVDAAKDIIYARLKVSEPGPGYCHFAGGDAGHTTKFFEQLTAEKVTISYSKGRPKRSWVKASSARNEALDCRVYAYAALVSLNVDWKRELKRRKDAPRLDLPESNEEEEVQETFVPVPVVPAAMPKFRRSSRPSGFMRR